MRQPSIGLNEFESLVESATRTNNLDLINGLAQLLIDDLAEIKHSDKVEEADTKERFVPYLDVMKNNAEVNKMLVHKIEELLQLAL